MATEVRAEMVANVGSIVVSPGDLVADGDTLVILESMKMEIPVLAETAGTVAEVRVSEGDVVQEGDVIACLLYTSPSPRDRTRSRMPSSA